MDPVDNEPNGEHGGTDAAGAGLANLTGKQIGRYLIGQQLGSGGAATVYRAYDQVQGITVALKLLLPGADEKAYDRFRREATLAGALRHPHIVRILQIGIAPKGEVAYIAMELVEGESLADLLNQRIRLRPEETANLLEPIARALAYAHRQGVIHRDVKPGNILLRPVSPGAPNSVQLESLEHPVVPLLTDFGIARALDAPELTSAGRTVGTPAYMAPEQCAGSREVDGRADIYSLGAVLYRAITGRLPFSGTTTQILHAHVYDPLTIDDAVLRLLPPIMVEILQRSMAKQPEQRYPNADAMADALAIAAGRLPLAPSGATGENTATLTLASLPVMAPPPLPATSTVLVPGVGDPATMVTPPRGNPLVRPPITQSVAATGAQGAEGRGGWATSAGNPPAQPPGDQGSMQLIDSEDGLGGRLERLNWPGIALTAVLGLLVVALIVVFGIRGPGLLERLTGGATPTPGEVSQITSTPIGLPGVVLTTTMTAAVTPVQVTATATFANTATAPAPPPATATFTPVPTDTPLPPPTDTPLPLPTDTPTMTPMPTATQTPTLTPTVAAPPTPGINPTLATCLDKIDPALQPYLMQQSNDVQTVFGCPDAPGQMATGQSLRFEHGYIVGFDNSPEMVVVYDDTQQWERQFVQDEGAGPPQVEPPPADNLFVPTGRFGTLWAQGDRRQQLGYAVSPEPGTFQAVYQLFPGALLILNRDSGALAVLPVANQR